MILELLVLASALAVGFNIGANDAANTMGACVGGGALGLRRAVTLAAVFVFLGGILGTKVTETISEGIVAPSELTSPVVVVCLLASGGLVALATLRGLPVSTSHAVVMAIVGAGLALEAKLNTTQLFWMASAWVIFPLATIPLSFLIVRTVKKGLSRAKTLVGFEIAIKYLLIFSGIYASFALGASHAGLAGGLLEGSGFIGRFPATIASSLAIGVGVFLLSRRVIRTIGREITSLSPVSALAMQLSAAIGLMVCSILGYPISSSQGIVAAAIGVGLSEGRTSVNRRKIGSIVLSWLLVPAGAVAICFLLVRTVIM